MITFASQPEQYDDRQIIDKILQGETALFEMLIRRHNPVLYKTGRAYGYHHEDTEDLMQETFISAFMNLSKFEGRSSFKTWITKIMIHQCYQKKQRLSFRNELLAPHAVNENSTPMYSSDNHIQTGKAVINHELNRVIESSLEQVPPEYRLVFALREINGLSVSETAGVLGISESNVKVRLNRAKAMLRGQVEKVYSPEELYEFNLIYCDRMVNRVMSEIRKA
jgi:RNA polymerase sigma factor (sigma-70 family)